MAFGPSLAILLTVCSLAVIFTRAYHMASLHSRIPPRFSCRVQDTLLLSNNKFSQLAELEPLADLPRLERLSLLGNPVTRQPHYRLYVIALLPKLRLLDFNKVKAQERLDALKMFGVIKRGGKGGAASAAAASSSSSSSSSSAAASASASAPAKTFVPGGDLPSSSANSNASSEVRRLTPELKEAIKVGIANAQTMEEIDALEKALSTGRIPRSLASRLNLPVDEPAAASSSSSSTDADMGQ